MVKAKPLPPISVLREHFSYCPETGDITRIKAYHPTKCGVVNSVRANGYKSVSFQKKSYLAHRIAWLLQTGQEPEQSIDHINGDSTDNRWCNLRIATQDQQKGNSASPGGKYLPGTRPSGKGGKWQAASGSTYLGVYETEQEAHQAYVVWHRQTHGEFSVYERPCS